KQKGEKFARRTAFAVPGVNLFATLHSVGRAGWKKFVTKNKGEQRNRAAGRLVRHHFTHDCGLAEAIIGELYSEQEMLWIKHHCDWDFATQIIAAKLKSV
ncbi:MAG: hypothetical protein N2C14_28535, partial [Planctomycetales bacterium]